MKTQLKLVLVQSCVVIVRIIEIVLLNIIKQIKINMCMYNHVVCIVVTEFVCSLVVDSLHSLSSKAYDVCQATILRGACEDVQTHLRKDI